MRRGRPKSELALSGEEREQLEALVRSRSLPAGLVRRARIVLQAAAGEANSAIAKRLKLNEATVGKWRRRFVTHRLQGLHDELRPGRPRSLEDEEVAELINRALHTKPVAATQWSVRSFARSSKVSASMAYRLFKLAGLQPHRQKSFKLSTDPFFIEKVRASSACT